MKQIKLPVCDLFCSVQSLNQPPASRHGRAFLLAWTWWVTGLTPAVCWNFDFEARGLTTNYHNWRPDFSEV